MKEKFEKIKLKISYFLKNHYKIILIIVGVILVLDIIAQFIYPTDRLLPNASVEGILYSGWSKSDVIKDLDAKYKDHEFSISFGQSEKLIKTLLPADIGITIDNQNRINDMNYPWYLRLVPSSIFWSHLLTDKKGDVNYIRDNTVLDSYIAKRFGESCSVDSINASLKVEGGKFNVVSAVNGGECDIATVRAKLQVASPTITGNYVIAIPIKETVPAISDVDAKNFADDLYSKVKNGVNIGVNGVNQLIPADNLIGWIDFTNENGILDFNFNLDRATDYMDKEIAPKVEYPAGTSYVSTYNFVETSRINGENGLSLDKSNTLKNIKSFINGSSSSADLAMTTISPNTVYDRSYSPTDAGLSALLQQYAQDHTGTFGISMIELSGNGRRASYNDTERFTSASTYKLFVAYSVLKRIEDGSWNWTDGDISGGRDLSTCFDDMIVRSDNACAEAMAEKITYGVVTSEAREIGCNDTTFGDSDGMNTTPADLALFLAQLQTGQILKQQSSRDILLNAMSRNIYRNGIPAGLSSMAVADKVGFLDGYLHDASIVYSPSGTYVLVIMTSNSDWSTIADLATKIEALRNQ